MHAEPKTHYKGYIIVANPVETIRRRFMDIFTIHESEHATFRPLPSSGCGFQRLPYP